MRSLDFVSEYIDECPWLRVARETPKGVRSQPNGSNNKDMARGRCIFLPPSAASQSSLGGKKWRNRRRSHGWSIRTFLIRPLNGKITYKVTFSPAAVTLICISPLLLLKKLASPCAERKSASSPTPERGRTTPRHRQERRGRERGADNKENVAAHSKEGDLFALPPPRTPVSSRKNARQKNVLTTPNQTSNGHAVTPKGERSLLRPV